jgi:hypothetical protein
MSSTDRRSAIPEHVLPLPEKPNLEFEHKRAKQLLREIHQADVPSLERVRHYRSGVVANDVKLADVQLTVARDYGFTSWSKLVEFFETLDRHAKAGPKSQSYRRDYYEMQVHSVIRSHSAKEPHVTRGLSAFVPRFYGRTDAEIFAASVTEVEAKLVVSRMQRFLSWNALTLFAEDRPREREMPREYPHEGAPMSFMRSAASSDDVSTLSRALLRGMHVKTEDVALLLQKGANPEWVPPSGVPILEYALMSYWNPEAVDLLARQVTPRKGFWISAGLGDTDRVLSFLDQSGRPNAEARKNRPDFVLVGFNMPCRPDADDLEILWEAFAVAGFNQRLNVIDALLHRGFPIDYAEWGSTLLQWAQGNRITVLAEHLLKRATRPTPG